jgi:hypothetical protein
MEFLRLLLSTFFGVYLGYTLQPVPRVIDVLFRESQIFKFLIMSCFIFVNLLGMEFSIMNVITSVVLSAILLAGFEYARKF